MTTAASQRNSTDRLAAIAAEEQAEEQENWMRLSNKLTTSNACQDNQTNLVYYVKKLI